MPSDPAPTVEVCIVAYRSRATIAASVASAALIKSSVAVAVHDNCPDESSVGAAEAEAQRIGVPFRAEECERNCGFAAACNALAAGSRADALLFLNPDASLEDWPYGDAVPTSSIEAPVIADSAGQVRTSWATAERTLADEVRARWLRRPPPVPAGVGTVSGAVMLVGRTLFNDLGGFDPRFFMYYEDIDFCGRAVQLGFPVLVREDWHARHAGGQSASSDLCLANLRSYRAARTYHQKWGHHLRAFDLLCLVDAAARSLQAVVTSGSRGASLGVARDAWWNILGG